MYISSGSVSASAALPCQGRTFKNYVTKMRPPQGRTL